jgi:thioredoxin-like negative regulator of GroEL
MAPDPVPPVAAYRPQIDHVVPQGDPRARPDFGAGRPSAPRAPVDDLLVHGSGHTPTETLLALVRDALEEGHPEVALRLLDPWWSAGQNREECWCLRTQALYQLKRFAEAGDVAEQGLARLPDSVALRYLLANCELSRGDGPGAERAMRAALALAPDQPVVLCRLAEWLGRTGRGEEAGRLVRRAAAAAPGHPLVAHEQLALARAPGHPPDPAAPGDRLAEPYTRAGIALSLVAAPPAVRPAASVPHRWSEAIRLAWLGAAVILFVSGHRAVGLVLGLTTIAGPILWRARAR